MLLYIQLKCCDNDHSGISAGAGGTPENGTRSWRNCGSVSVITTSHVRGIGGCTLRWTQYDDSANVSCTLSTWSDPRGLLASAFSLQVTRHFVNTQRFFSGYENTPNL